MNEEQKQAIEYNKGPLLIVAGAGTGKTHVITEKIRYLIEKKLAKPEEILALTFTDKAAREMEERVDKAIPYGYFQMWISTFHSFADQILREEIAHIGLNPSFKLMTEAESIIFLRNNLFLFDLKYFRPLANPTKFLEALLQHFSRLKDEDISAEEYMKWIQKTKEEKEKNIELARAYDLYQKLKIKEGFFDFSDLIYYLLVLFRKRKNILEKYRKLFRYFLIDEFQDTNIAQYELIKLLCPPAEASAKAGPNLTVVGDDSQAIYKFRGASVSNILGFMKDYPKSKQITLRKNYRSVQPILDVAYRLIKHNDPDTLEAQLGISKKLVAIRQIPDQVGNDSGQSAVDFYLAENAQKEADFVADEILKLKKGRGYTFSDFAILIRANNYAEPFTRSLLQRGIPYQFWGPGMLFKQPEIKDIIAYLNVLSNLDDSLSLYRVLSMNAFDIDSKDISLLLTFAKKCNLSLFQGLEVCLSEEFSIYKPYIPQLSLDSKQRLLNFFKMLKRHLGLIKKETAGQILYYFLEDSKILSQLVNYKSEREERRAFNISKFFYRLKSYEAEHEDASVFSVVDYIKMSMELGESPLIAQIDISLYDAVNILTVHATKGLEFPVVFLINLTKGRFPSIERLEAIPIPQQLIKEILPQGNYHELEERRLFYVGLTRAMDKAYLTAAQFYGEGKRGQKISRFVLETLGEENIKKEIEIKSEQKAQLSIFDYKKTEEKIIRKQISINFFSFSQIYAFLSCPLQYKLKYILKIPEPPTAAMSFGNTIHTSLEGFYREFSHNKKLHLQRLLQIYRNSWIPLGYSSKSHQDRMKKEGEKMLINYFSKLHNSNINIVDLEKFFTVKIDDISIAGKIDRVDKKTGGKIEIIDYKTGKKSDEKEARKNLQLSIYFLAATDPRLYNKKPEEVTLTFYFLQHAEKVSIQKDDKDISEVKNKIREIVEQIRSTDFSSPSLKACNKCSYCLLYSDTYL